MYHKEVPLEIEQFKNDEDIELRVDSKIEMRSMLQSIADHGIRVALFYDDDRNFILTTLLGTDEQGMWLDIGPSPPENKQILLSNRITFVSVYLHAKIQFVAHDIKSDLFKDKEAFYLELPDYLVRVQRRDFFRNAIPAEVLVKCMIPLPPGNPHAPATMREVPLVDISGNGIGLLCGEHEDTLLPRKTFPNCQIPLPGVGTLEVTIEVRNNVNFTSPNNVVHTRVGCSFVRLDNQMSILLQRYIAHLQRESLARG